MLLNCGVGEDFESPLDCKEIKPVNPKGNQPWIFIGRTVLQLKLQYFGYLMQRADSLEKTWCWERLRAGGNRVTEDEMVGWHHWLNGHEFEQAPGVGDGQGSLQCCISWGRKESDMCDWTGLGGSVVKNLPAMQEPQGEAGSIPGSERSPEVRHGYPRQFSCLENPMDRRAWLATVHGVAKSWTQLEWLSTHRLIYLFI